jgi:hypothetical protein
MRRKLLLTIGVLVLLSFSGTILAQDPSGDTAGAASPAAACTHSHSVGGVPLDQCYAETFTDKDGNTRTISVFYTLNTTHNGNPHNHWISNATQAQNVGGWGREAWLRYELDSDGVEPYHTGCDSNIDVLIQDGPWGGIAWWASSGDCEIGINAVGVRGGGNQGTTYHEFQHYEQYGFDDCYDDWQGGYSGNAEWIEGYADYGRSTVAALNWYGGNVYDPHTNMYDRSYGNRFVIYFSEQVSTGLGPNGTPADPWYRSNGMYEHYRECEAQDDLYVERTVVQNYTPYSYEQFFANFFAANWAMSYADPATQPELQYWEDDIGAFSPPLLDADVFMAAGSQSWTGESTPAHWAGRYYQIHPQAGCDYITLDVDGEPGAVLGISLMAADTAAPSVVRSGSIGEDFVRTFAAHGVHDRLVAVVNAFNHNYDYDVTATCVNPQIDILEPLQANPAFVGEPAAPIAFITRLRVTSGGVPVRGIPEDWFALDAEGDAVGIVPGTFGMVGLDYWMTALPPIKPAGTTFVDYRACLNSGACDTEVDSLLYVAPGNSDLAIVHDASGSMGPPEDTPGEGTRLENAQKAAKAIANTVRTGDRVLVMDFSALDDPGGCGLPYGDGNCTLDLQVYLPRRDITDPAVDIPIIEAAINDTTARDWTPLGAALRDAKNYLQAAPYSMNPKYAIILSDGKENVNPLVADVQAEIVASGVIYDTVAFGGDADEALLASLAALTGGSYRQVPTTSTAMTDAETTQRQIDELMALGLPAQEAESMVTAFLPGPLALADAYDYFETEAQDAARLLHDVNTYVADNTWETASTRVDRSATSLRLLVTGKEFDADVINVCEGYHREVEVLPPGQRIWIPVSPPNPKLPPPASWDIRNSAYSDAVIISNPEVGVWTIRSKYYYGLCTMQDGEWVQSSPVDEPQYLETDFFQNGSVQSTIHLEGRFLEPIVNNQGLAGDIVPIVATLLDRQGTLPGALVVASIEAPGGTSTLWLPDDGAHGDAAAGDGIYANTYLDTKMGGSYNVRILAYFQDPAGASGENIFREWYGSFWIKGPQEDDEDDDGMPRWWEEEQPCLDPTVYEAYQDPDGDGLVNIDEWYNGTYPCVADTDAGGENDGSEVQNGRDPLDPSDDKVPPLVKYTLQALNGKILIRWWRPMDFTAMLLYLSGDGSSYEVVDMGDSGEYELPWPNDTPVWLRLAGYNGDADATGDLTDPEVVTPKADPDAPSGVVFINGDAPSTKKRDVVLDVSATDEPIGGLPSPGSAATIANRWMAENEISGAVEMRFAHDPAGPWTAWEALAATKAWRLPGDCGYGELCNVYAQFRDAALNESLIAIDSILYQGHDAYLPLIAKKW